MNQFLFLFPGTDLCTRVNDWKKPDDTDPTRTMAFPALEGYCSNYSCPGRIFRRSKERMEQ